MKPSKKPFDKTRGSITRAKIEPCNIKEIFGDSYGSHVDHPAHYNQGSIEVIDAIDDWKLGFCLGNAVKYIARANHKGNPIEDLEKAVWYLQHEIERRKNS